MKIRTSWLVTLLIFLPGRIDFSSRSEMRVLKRDISTSQFKLISEGQSFLLRSLVERNKKDLVVPREWFITSREESEEEDSIASSFNFKEQVTSFPIGKCQIGNHLSSFDASSEGSSQAAAGRDLFLIYDSQSSDSLKGQLDFGITKTRARHIGCFLASTSHFLLGDINQDGMTDIGQIREELECEEYYDVKEDVDAIKGPFYEQHPVRWYVFQGRRWMPDGRYDGKFPEQYSEMPLIGIQMSTLDYAAYVTWKSYDPRKWHSRLPTAPTFVPSYRRRLMEE